jgi:hypothetical protein
LKKFLDEISLSTVEFRKRYEIVMRSHRREPGEENQSPAQMAELLYGLQDADESRIPPVFEFAERIAQIDSQDVTVRAKLNELSEWIGKNVKPQSFLVDLQKKMQAEATEKVHYRIVIDVSDSGCIEYWLYKESEFQGIKGEKPCQCSPESVRDAVLELLKDLRERVVGKLFFEFLLSFEQLLWEIDHWEDADTYTHLGAAYPVVLRWRDRHVKRGEIVGNWRRAAEKIKTQSGRDVFWLPNNVVPLQKLLVYLRDKTYGRFVGFAAVPCGSQKPEIGKMLSCLLKSGVPYAFWPRKDACDWDVFRNC